MKCFMTLDGAALLSLLLACVAYCLFAKRCRFTPVLLSLAEGPLYEFRSHTSSLLRVVVNGKHGQPLSVFIWRHERRRSAPPEWRADIWNCFLHNRACQFTGTHAHIQRDRLSHISSSPESNYHINITRDSVHAHHLSQLFLHFPSPVSVCNTSSFPNSLLPFPG